MSGLEAWEALEAQEAVEGLTEADLEYLKGIEGLKSEEWEKLEPKEKLEALQELENKLAEIQGRPAYRVVGQDLPCTTYGYFDGEKIVVNNACLGNESMRLDVIDTIAHEGRHAYQHYAVEHPGFHPDEHEVEYWRANFETYLQPNLYGFDAYWMQPVEVDARRYGGVVSALFEDDDTTATA